MKRSYVKLEEIKNESYEKKEYLSFMTLESARMNFRIRSKMIKCKFNYSSDRRNVISSWRCDSCMRMGKLSMETQPHILVCPSYRLLREGKSMSSLEDITEYYRKVMIIRDKLLLDC